MSFKLSQKDIADQNLFFINQLEKIPDSLPVKLISQLSQEKRVLPAGTPRPGPLDLMYTPYLIEPMDNMSPMHPIQRTIILKGAQLGFTMLIECVICYYIGYSPADMLFISATDDLIERWATRRLEPAINSYGYRELIRAIDDSTSKKRVGDKMYSKEYYGMRLDMTSAQSAAGLRSSDKRVLIRDEIDGAPAQLKTGEGNWLSVSEARTISWGDRKKILDGGTPTTFADSLIYPAYEQGDCRHFFVPCPHCDKFIEFKFEQLQPESEAGVLVDVIYACQECGAIIYNHDKMKMYMSGKCHYRATKPSNDPNIRSYYINSLYSPVGMLSWLELYKKYVEAQKSDDVATAMRSFTNLYLGLPYMEQGRRPKIDNITELKSGYKSGTVPKGVLFLTVGMDVQQGAQKWDKLSDHELDELIKNTPESEIHKMNFPRVEFEVLGHAAGYITYSIKYKAIYGHIDNAYAGAWEKLNEFAETCELCDKKCNYKSPGCNKFCGGLAGYADNLEQTVFYPEIIFIDSGDGNYSDIVYKFCERWGNTFAIKGMHDIHKKSRVRSDKVDEIIQGNRERFKRTRSATGDYIFLINTNHYKSIIYRNIKIPRIEVGEPKTSTMFFPRDYDERYFKMLTAEEKREDGTFYCPDHTRNESLDVRVYNLCAADVFLENMVLDLKASVKNNGGSKDDIDKIDTRFVIEQLKKQVLQ